MTEFAIIVPVFMLIVVGMLVFGRLFFYWIETNHLANETARWAVVDNNPYDDACPGGPWTGQPGCQTLQQHARSSATNEFEDNVRVCIQLPAGETLQTINVGDPVTVRVQVPVSFAEFFGFGVTLRGTSTMRLENIRDGVAPSAFSDAADPSTGNIGPCS
jgi:uncharacterized protein (DUF2249 family)